jgi:uncharacterized protein (TIGR00299 family) protein
MVYFDCASGVSGDMVLGALVDLGLSIEALRQALAGLPLRGYRIEAREVKRAGIRALKVDVVVEEAEHRHGHRHANGHGHSRVRRGLREVLDLIERSTLSPRVRDRATILFRRLAEAEAEAHATTVEEVHFHEVGAIDSIVDIVGSVYGLSELGAEQVFSSPLNLGSGTVTMAHGTFPVPAPATARLVTGVPVHGDGEGELTTPTGALLVTGHATAYGPLPLMKMERVGCGAGSRESSGRPNVLRLILGESLATGGPGERVAVLETEIDDMSPQFCGPLVEKLLAAGAFDAYFTPIFMKKGRPGILVTALVDPARRAPVEELFFRETTTLGIRRWECDRTCLEREIITVETAYGTVRVKQATRTGRIVNAQPEFDDCERIAREQGVAVKEVWAAAFAAARLREGPRD